LNAENQQFVLERSQLGKVAFYADFVKNVQTMPLPNLPIGEYEVRILMD
tara:strand:- start:14003 stop:14149 length:147 start_codon:yes stop_codon:yes gene_type:complete